MFTTINAGRLFKILLNALILLILVIQPVPAQEETPDTSLPGQVIVWESIRNAKLESNSPGKFVDPEEGQDNAGTGLSSLGQITVPAYDMGQYHEGGSHSTPNLNYLVGWSSIKGTYH